MKQPIKKFKRKAKYSTEDYWELIYCFVRWCNDNYLKLNICRNSDLVVDCQRNRRHPVLFVILGEVKRVDSYKYLGIQSNKKIALDNQH
ncbi:hypothetical protein GJAV_G00056620 [Gymnothorax javanicus]|nr:hypothetical protein GJAV_G00056620 [Gymnothorax javanicus]